MDTMHWQKARSLMKKHDDIAFDSCWLSGSHAYGTAHADSDLDIRGMHHVDTRILCDPTLTQDEIKHLHYIEDDQDDFSSESMIRFIDLNLQGNANACEALWLPEHYFFQMGDAMTELRRRREVFLSKKLFFAHGQYAIKASKALKAKRKKIETTEPVRRPWGVDYLHLVACHSSSYRLQDYAEGYQLIELHGGTFGLYPAPGRRPWTTEGELQISDREIDAMPSAIVKYDAKGYQKAMMAFKSYQSWWQGSTRRREEEASGYSGKSAMHIVRLLRIAKEMGEEGVVNIVRPDADHLLAIRWGQVDYQDVLEEIDTLTQSVLAMGKHVDLPQCADAQSVRELYRAVQR